MRVAYLIAAHTLPEQTLRLARRLRGDSPEAVIALHHNPQRGGVDERALAALGVRRILPPTIVTWGDASQQTMMLRCFARLLEREEFDWLVLLSGQDYPIRPVPEIERALAATDVDGFIEAVPVPRPSLRVRDLDEFARRYHYRWRRAPASLSQALARARPFLQLARMPSGTWLGVPAWPSPFGPELLCHRGADWFTLSRRAVEEVVGFLAAHPEVRRHYARVLFPTESLVHTVLANSGLRLSADNRRFSRWEPGSPSPRVLSLEDLPAAYASGFDIARKFDDPAVLDAIDREVHGE